MSPAHTALAVATAIGGGLPRVYVGGRDRDAVPADVQEQRKADAGAKRARRAAKRGVL